MTVTVTLNADKTKTATFEVTVKADRTGKEAWREEACRSAERLSKTGASVAGVAGAFALLLAAGVAVTVSRKCRA